MLYLVVFPYHIRRVWVLDPEPQVDLTHLLHFLRWHEDSFAINVLLESSSTAETTLSNN